MKYLTVIIPPFKIKGDLEDEETLTHDVYEKVAAMLEAETLSYTVDEEEEDQDDDY